MSLRHGALRKAAEEVVATTNEWAKRGGRTPDEIADAANGYAQATVHTMKAIIALRAALTAESEPAAPTPPQARYPFTLAAAGRGTEPGAFCVVLEGPLEDVRRAGAHLGESARIEFGGSCGGPKP